MNVVYFLFGLIQVVLALRFVMLLLGANQDAGFVQMIMALSAPFMAPFIAVFGTTVMNGSVFEWSALLAVVMYALLAWGVVALIEAVSPRYSASTVETYEETRQDKSASEAGSAEVDRRGDHYGRGTPAH